MEKLKKTHSPEVHNYPKANFERLFELTKEVFKKDPEMFDPFLKDAEKLVGQEENAAQIISRIDGIFDRLTELTTPARYANAPRKRLTPSSQKVRDYKLHVSTLIQTGQIDVHLAYFF